ncbi:MAG: MerR family transcriptional regulator, partial [Myxococcota bacterium]|nr:MerR family transcriptional regulator [Myxococcota bacterium]
MSQYSLPDAARILSVSPARLRYWERTELVSAGSDESEQTRFEFADLVRIRGVLALLDQGVPLRRIRRHVEAARRHMPELQDPIRSLQVWLEGSDRIVVRHEGALLEPGGQAVLDFGDPDEVRVKPVAEL